MERERDKTKRALALVDQGKIPYVAAVEIGIRPSAVYVALAKRKMVPCPCCGSLVKPERVKSAPAITIDAYPIDHPATRIEVKEPSFRDQALTWLEAQAEQQPDPVGKKWISAIAKGLRSLGG